MNDVVEEGRVVSEMVAEAGMVATLNRSEIDQQIATAKKYPRSVANFIKRATELVSLNESIAQQCIYALPRDGKVIEGPSARMAEVIFNAWGNARAGARVVSDTGEFITAQGVFQDLEQNTAITYEVQRRITDKRGNRYKADMIGVTGNAASSIALRNAILKGIPKAYWEGIYKKARAVVAGDIKTLANKRIEAIQSFVIFGITEAQILAKLGKSGIADINTDDLVLLFGLLTAIKEGDTTPENAFAAEVDTHVQQPKSKSEQNSNGTAVSRETGASGGASSPTTESAAPAAQSEAGLPAKENGGAAHADATGRPRLLTEGERELILAKLTDAALTNVDLQAKFGKLETLVITQFDTVKKWIGNPAG